MKRILTICMLLFIGIAITGAPVYAQKNKDKKAAKEEKKRLKREAKAWKNRAKNYAKNPLSLRDDLENSNRQIKSLNEKLKECNERFGGMQNAIDSLSNLVSAKNSELAANKAKYSKLEAAYEAQKNINEKGIIPGLVYKVQIGAFVYFDINKYLKDTEKNFEGETADGMNKYTMGNFRDLEVADQFKQDVQKMGIKDAWVVPYIDGVRVTMEEAKKYLGGQGS